MLWDLTPLQRELADYMSELSEKAIRAGWMSGLEYELWKAVIDGPRQYLWLFVDAEMIARLRRLSNEIGGWIIFHDDWEETFVPMGAWRLLYAEWDKQQEAHR